MMGRPLLSALQKLPETIPIFPLTGTLLLPRGRLPLNIFEPRYLDMTADALAGDRLIGMVQPLEPEAEERDDAPSVYPTGCAGRITAFEETEDGRYEILLTGLCRFDIVAEEPNLKRYRRARVRWDHFAGDLDEGAPGPIERESLVRSLHAYLTRRALDADWDAIGDLTDDELVTRLAMFCPFRPSEKQALLESRDQGERARNLATLMEMALHEEGQGDLPHH
jgi:Lon protease-like protein